MCSGIFDVAEAYLAAIKSVNADSHEALTKASIQEKANSFSEHLRSDQNIAVSKIQDGLQNLSYVVLSNSMPAAWKPEFSACLVSANVNSFTS